MKMKIRLEYFPVIASGFVTFFMGFYINLPGLLQSIAIASGMIAGTITIGFGFAEMIEEKKA